MQDLAVSHEVCADSFISVHPVLHRSPAAQGAVVCVWSWVGLSLPKSPVPQTADSQSALGCMWFVTSPSQGQGSWSWNGTTTQVSRLGREDPLEKEMATHSSILAWRIPWIEEPGRLPSMWWQRVRHDWATNTYERKVLEMKTIENMGWSLEDISSHPTETLQIQLAG